MFRLRSIGLRMFRLRPRRRVISVTRRHIDFLFGVSNVKQVRAVERIIKRNREETVMPKYERLLKRLERIATTEHYFFSRGDQKVIAEAAALIARLSSKSDDR